MFARSLLILALILAPASVFSAEDLRVTPADENAVTGQGANLLQPGAGQLQAGQQTINQSAADNSLQSAGTSEQLRQYLEGEVDSGLLAAAGSENPETSRGYFWGLVAAVLAGSIWLALDYRRHVRL